MLSSNTWLCCVLIGFLVICSLQDSVDQYEKCPALNKQCYCRRKYNTEDNIYCENLGRRKNLPRFGKSDAYFMELHIRYNSTIKKLQDYAFSGLKLQELFLQDLSIEVIDEDAFRGLESYLSRLHLDGNKLTYIPRDTILSLRNLHYLGLHNNKIVSPPMVEAVHQLLLFMEYIYLFNNEIEQLHVGVFSGMQSLKGLKLNNNRLQYLVTGVFDSLEQLQELELQYNFLGTLPINIFRYLSRLVKLDLSHNNIYLLLTGAFYGLRQLQSLQLDHNMLSEFQIGVFSNIPRIKYLKLSHNSASSIIQGIFDRLRHVRVLDLSYNRISRIETKSFKGLYRLKKLYLRGNNLFNLDFLLKSFLNGLESLDLHDNNITTMLDPNVFRSIQNLQNLDLSKNLIGNVYSGIFGHLRNLQSLSLSENPMYFLREGAFDIKTLLELDLKSCRLRWLHENAFSDLENLYYLWMDNNEIQTLPNNIFNGTSNLQILSLTSNHLTYLARGMFKGLRSIKQLHIDNNSLRNISEYSLIYLGSLEELTLANNNISGLYEHSFNDLKQLKYLDLSYNLITDLGASMSRLETITSLVLKGNPLRYANWYNFFYNTLENLKTLDLSNCNIEVLYLDGLLFILTNVAEFNLYLYGNPLLCSGCDLSWLTWIPFSRIHAPNLITCNTPYQMIGVPVLCSFEESCLNEEVRNNTQIQDFCSPWPRNALQTSTVSNIYILPHNTTEASHDNLKTSTEILEKGINKITTNINKDISIQTAIGMNIEREKLMTTPSFNSDFAPAKNHNNKTEPKPNNKHNIAPLHTTTDYKLALESTTVYSNISNVHSRKDEMRDSTTFEPGATNPRTHSNSQRLNSSELINSKNAHNSGSLKVIANADSEEGTGTDDVHMKNPHISTNTMSFSGNNYKDRMYFTSLYPTTSSHANPEQTMSEDAATGEATTRTPGPDIISQNVDGFSSTYVQPSQLSQTQHSLTEAESETQYYNIKNISSSESTELFNESFSSQAPGYIEGRPSFTKSNYARPNSASYSPLLYDDTSQAGSGAASGEIPDAMASEQFIRVAKKHMASSAQRSNSRLITDWNSSNLEQLNDPEFRVSRLIADYSHANTSPTSTTNTPTGKTTELHDDPAAHDNEANDK